MFLNCGQFFIFSIYGISFFIFTYFINVHIYFHSFLSYYSEEPNEIYDYIIVGSGVGGSITTYRLAQETQNTVLLIEAGPYSNFLFDVPIIGPLLQRSSFDWQYKTVPQKYSCYGLINNVSRWPMGKIFGGTSCFNNMIHVRGSEHDYNEWYKYKTDYNYQTDVLYYFNKLENTNFGGPLYSGYSSFNTLLAKTVKETGVGLKSCLGGFTKPRTNLKSAKRWTASKKLLEKNFPNLHILTNTQATKILFLNNYEAYGVEYNRFGRKRVIKARKGIILSSGIIGTPKLLMLSGLGPREHLQQLGIKVLKDLPVGNNLQDHITTGLDLITINETLQLNLETVMRPDSIYNYFARGLGPLTSIGCDLLAFCNGTELQLMVLPGGSTTDLGVHLRNAFSFRSDIWSDYFTPLIGRQVISIVPILLHPKSIGTVRLLDSDPETRPVINPNYLEHPDDVETLIHGIELMKELIKTEPFRRFGAELYRKPLLGCERYEFDTVPYWECYVRHITLTGYHPVGTCKMGHLKDETSVVDYQFRVIGTNKLFVVDGSVLPTQVTGNVHAAIAMMAERAADVIKNVAFLSKRYSHVLNVFIPENICSI